jgi:hypothetical protein
VRQAGAIVIEARRALRMIALVLAVWLGPSAPALSDARASGAPEARGVAAESAGDATEAALRVAAAPAEPLDLTVTDGRITARLESAKLSDVAAAVFEQTEIEILFIDQIDHIDDIDDANTGPTVSDSFEALPLEDGLRRLYAGYNFVPVYGQKTQAADAEPMLVRVMILPSAEGEAEPPVDAGEDRAEEEAEAAALTQAPTPQEVLDDLIATLQTALSDSLNTAEDAEDEEVAAMLETLLEHDLEALVESAQGSDPGESPTQQLESLTEQLEEQLQSAGTANPGADPRLPSGGGLPIE